MKISNFRGELTDISAKEEALASGLWRNYEHSRSVQELGEAEFGMARM